MQTDGSPSSDAEIATRLRVKYMEHEEGQLKTSGEYPSVLQEADKLIHGDRMKDYGPPNKNFEDIAAGWSRIVGVTVSAVQVGLCMDWLKTCRIVNGNGNSDRDSLLDKAGYTGCVAILAGFDPL